MVVNVEKLLKMVIFQNLSKHGEMLKNVGENIKKILLWFSFTLWILKIQYLTQSFTNIFAISTDDIAIVLINIV